MRWVNVQEIYADGKHNAWPDICRWRGQILRYIQLRRGRSRKQSLGLPPVF